MRRETGGQGDLARITALQRSAGNRAVNALIARDRSAPIAVQRHGGPSTLQQPNPGLTEGTDTTAGGTGLGTTTDGAEETTAAPQKPGVMSKIGGFFKRAGKAIAQTASNAAKKANIYARLAMTAEGRHAMWILLRYGVNVEVAGTEPGSYFTSGENKIYLNAGETAPSAAIILVHEAGHAETFHRVGDPDVMSMARDAYVKALIEDEARAVVRQIKVIGQFQSIKFNTTNTSVGDAQAQRYWQKYNEAVNAAPAGTGQAEKERLGETAGYNEVFNMFYDGTFVTSTTGQPYADYYGSFWDTSHAPAAPTGGG